MRVVCEWMEATAGVVGGVQPKLCTVSRRVEGVVVGAAFLPPRANAPDPTPALIVRSDDGEETACPVAAVQHDAAALDKWHDVEWSAWLARHGHAVPDTREARIALASSVLGRS